MIRRRVAAGMARECYGLNSYLRKRTVRWSPETPGKMIQDGSLLRVRPTALKMPIPRMISEPMPM